MTRARGSITGWQHLNEEERAALIENRTRELSALDYRATVMAANEHPMERGKPPVFVTVVDHRTGLFRVPLLLAVYLEVKAHEQASG